jgi:hypothetical protein
MNITVDKCHALRLEIQCLRRFASNCVQHLMAVERVGSGVVAHDVGDVGWFVA